MDFQVTSFWSFFWWKQFKAVQTFISTGGTSFHDASRHFTEMKQHQNTPFFGVVITISTSIHSFFGCVVNVPVIKRIRSQLRN
ncbi:MAG TPA: hypothetical protein DHV39_12600 [Verrucomicrobiales bacterium]|nr:hypothetical protein [Verrucomicrobiales bacterium]HBP56577.1 hypothetical protein [Verrucomicrobiales bacterium]HCP39083.1 hypothetical protein [Verrucomicrobiales bacterium]HCZ04227.1 hypothetical protein [Verrucomicrobiales bacterium]